ncbi:MAG TPA: glycosyltransferase family 1 protein [Edaphocola sp.]|nr:glycosyltransferase family 1 protein [Edaphocola sp.]
MYIGFDAKRAFFNKTGLGNYSRNLISALHMYYPENHYQLFTPSIKEDMFFRSVEEWHNTEIIHPGQIWPIHLWRSFGVIGAFKKHKTEIYHGLSAELPLGNISKTTKTVVTIHDLIFKRFPELYAPIDRAIYFQKTKNACHKANKIIAISEQTKRDVVEFVGIDPNQIDVIYQVCDSIFECSIKPEKKEQIKKKYGLPHQYLLSVGTLEFRKNALVILKALLALPQEIKLVLVGKATTYIKVLENFIQKHELKDRVVFLHNVAYLDLPGIYQMADIFIYPSIFEGFGIPIIEALKSKVPVIAATGSCLEEAGGPNSLYFNPNDEGQLITFIKHLLKDHPSKALQIEKSFEYANKFSYMQFAKDTMNLYRSIL